MKKIFLICLINVASLFSQPDFWTHHSLNTPVYQLVNYGDSILFAVRDIDIIKSTDMGLSWNTIYTTPYPCSAWTKLDLFQRRIINGQVYMIIRQRNGSSGCTSVPVCISTNSGQNWQNLNLPNGYFGDIDITSNGTLVLVSDTTYYSTNRGSSWNYLNTPHDGTLKMKIEVDNDDNIYVVRENKYWYEPAWIWFRSEYLYKSTDFGQNWQFLFNTIYEPNANFSTLFHTENNEVIASQSVPSRKTWYYKENSINIFPLWGISSAVILNSKFFFVSPPCCINQGVNYSSNFGQNWVSQNTGLTSLECRSIIKDTLGYLYVGTGNGIFKSNFSQLAFNLNPVYDFDDTGIGDTTFKQIEISNAFTFDLIIDSLKCFSDNFFISSIQNTIIPPNGFSSIEVAFNPELIGESTTNLEIYGNGINAMTQLVGKSPRPTLIVLPFTNFGSVTVGDTAIAELKLTSQSVNEILIDNLYMAINEQFFVDPLIFPLNIKYSDTLAINIYFVPTTQSLIFKKDTIFILSNSVNSEVLQVVTGRGVNPTFISDEELIIIDYSLSNCFPNPFNPSTTIEYSVPKLSKVRISVFNLVGEEIATIINEEKTQGRYRVEFNGIILPSGVYFYRMQADDFSSTKKFVLLK